MQFGIFHIHINSFCHILNAFKEHLKAEGYAPNSITAMSTVAAEFLCQLESSMEIYDILLVEPVHIQKHYFHLETRTKYGPAQGGLSGGMLCSHIYGLRMLFAFLTRTNLIEANPLSGNLDFPVSGNPYRIAITEEEVQTLFTACKEPIDRALLCLAYSGMRRREISLLNCQDIIWDEQYLIVVEAKYHKRRELPLPSRMLNYLKEYYQGQREELLNRQNEDSRKAFLLNKEGNRVTGGVAYRMFKEIVYRTELERIVTLHTLRHSFATHLKMRGCPVETIRLLMGHSSVDTTAVYLKYQEQALFRKSNTYEY